MQIEVGYMISVSHIEFYETNTFILIWAPTHLILRMLL